MLKTQKLKNLNLCTDNGSIKDGDASIKAWEAGTGKMRCLN